MLELDVGNTRIKWRFLDIYGQNQASGIQLSETQVFDFLDCGYLPKRVRVSCVRDKEFRARLGNEIGLRWGLEPEFAESQAMHRGLVNAYAQPQRLGVDRWLAMLAARERTKQAFCVVDAGSALTLDFVDVCNQHLGGYIVPGLKLQKSILLQNTAIQIPESTSQAQLCLGRSTESAIHNGVVGMVISWIIGECSGRLDDGELFLTGGDAVLIAEYLQNKAISCRVVPELVMDGLRVALP